MEKILTLQNEEESRQFARSLALKAKKGDIYFLYGELGAGKTFFVTEFCRTLGVTDYVSSPSYVLLNEYDANDFPIFHLDLYRLGSPEEILELGITDFTDEGIVFVEWPQIAEEILSQERVELYFEIVEDHRVVKIIDRRCNAIKTGS